MSFVDLNSYFQELALGDYCPSGDSDCPGPVMITRMVGAQAHGLCQHHAVQVRFPAHLANGFHGDKSEAGHYVIARVPGGDTADGSRLVQSTPVVRARLGMNEFPRTPGYMQVEYDERGAVQLLFTSAGSGSMLTVEGKHLDRYPRHVQHHLLDGYGVLCSLDMGNVSNVTWPEYALAVPALDNMFEDRLSA